MRAPFLAGLLAAAPFAFTQAGGLQTTPGRVPERSDSAFTGSAECRS